MKRFWIMLLAVAVALAIALPAGAKKPPKPEPEPEPRGGYTCVEYGEKSGLDWQYLEADMNPYTFTLGGGESRAACIDVLADAGEWTVTVGGSGGRGIAMTLRDSIAPGDLCFNEVYRGDRVGDYSLGYQPSSYVNACGTAWGELIDGELVMVKQAWVESPLAFIVRVTGSPNALTTITVDYP